jgi:DNA-binding GntR family transcriptional regulator
VTVRPDEREEIIAAIKAGDAEQADRLTIAHTAQIVRQIRDYIARDLDRPLAISIA